MGWNHAEEIPRREKQRKLFASSGEARWMTGVINKEEEKNK